MKKAIYIRTSTEEQTPELQIQDCESLLEENKQYNIFIDKQSAWKDDKDRLEFTRLNNEIKYKRVNEVIVWDLDRIYRNRKKLIGFFQYCKVYGCKIRSFRQKWLEDINQMPEPWNMIVHDLMLQIMGWLAEEESAKKSKRVKLAVTKKGDVTFSKYGRKWGRKEISTQKINKIISLSNEGGLSIRKIAIAVGVSVGVVHKILAGKHRKKSDKNGPKEIDQLMNKTG